jgi:hypothetical protein
MKSDHAARRLGRTLLVALAATTAAASCDFFGSDMFPKQLQNVAASYDLAASAGLSPDKVNINSIKRLVSSGGVSAVFVLTTQADGYKLFVLKDDLSLETTLSDSHFGQFLGTDATGNFVCGTAQISSDFASIVPAAYPTCYGNGLDIAGSANLLKYSDSAGTQIGEYPKSIATIIGAWTTIRSGYFYDMLDSEVLASGSRLFLLARDRGGATAMTVLGFPNSDPSISGSPLYADSSIAVTEVAGDWADQGWLTADGAIALVHSNNTELVRYAYGSGAKLDSIQIADESWMSGISFEATGDYWYYYDRYKGLIYKMRTWWK